MLTGLYFSLSIISVLCIFCAIVQARRIGYLVPLYFLMAWLGGELALIHLLWQVALTAIVAFTGLLDDTLGRWGLSLFALGWIGLVYLHCQGLDSAEALRGALRRALGEDYRAAIPTDRRAHLVDHIVSRSWMKPFHFRRDGVELIKHVAYGDAGKRNLLDIHKPVAPSASGLSGYGRKL